MIINISPTSEKNGKSFKKNNNKSMKNDDELYSEEMGVINNINQDYVNTMTDNINNLNINQENRNNTPVGNASAIKPYYDKTIQNRKLFVGGIPWQLTVEELREYFERFGELDDVKIMSNRETGKPRGFGFIIYKSPDVIPTILKKNHFLAEKRVEVKRAIPKTIHPRNHNSRNHNSRNQNHSPQNYKYNIPQTTPPPVLPNQQYFDPHFSPQYMPPQNSDNQYFYQQPFVPYYPPDQYGFQVPNEQYHPYPNSGIGPYAGYMAPEMYPPVSPNFMMQPPMFPIQNGMYPDNGTFTDYENENFVEDGNEEEDDDDDDDDDEEDHDDEEEEQQEDQKIQEVENH